MTTQKDMGVVDVISVPISRPASHPEVELGVQPPAHIPLVCRLVDAYGAAWVDEHSVQAWERQGGDRVLLLVGDTVRYPQGLDVAAVLPELRKCAARPFAVAVVPRSSEDAVAKRFGANHWPSLVFFRDGYYITAIGGMHDWLPYLHAVNAALQMPPSRAPTIGIPVVGASQHVSSCGKV